MANTRIRLKVCGMRFPHNMYKIAQMKPDYLGFIFYDKSRRYMADDIKPKEMQELPKQIQKVGVFVNATTQEILKQAKKFKLDLIQLHGQESPEQCQEIKKAGLKVIKVFSIGQEDFDFEQLEPYKPHVNFFLFDTAGKHPGGNGETFDWGQLRAYDQEIPFFLSGGISLDNVPQLSALTFFNIHGIDVNSRFEMEPGLKDVNLIQKLKDKLYGNDKRKTERVPFQFRRKNQ